ncbi:sensor histidine kinase [Desulfolithobacter sp.]
MEKGWDQICETLEYPLFIVRPDGIITAANQAAAKASRRPLEEIINKGICYIIHGGRLPHIRCPLEEFLLTAKTSRIMETRLPGLFGDYLLSIAPSLDENGDVSSFLLIARELSGEEARKVEYYRTAQLASIGELAAGVAHEVNNPINGIINFAQLLLDEAENPEEKEILGRIVREGERIASITSKLLSFARTGGSEREPLNIKDVLDNCLALIQHQLKKDSIAISTRYEDNLPDIIGNSQKLQQVFFNLLSNSRYALNQRYSSPSPDKKITIKCATVTNELGIFVRVTIKDLGTGIPQGLLDRIILPFFTTKPAGDGTGLGLSISHGIIRDHEGTLRIDSVLHQYTTVTVDLPVAASLHRALQQEDNDTT